MTGVDNFPYLPISDGNQLVLTNSNRSQKRGMDNDDDYYDEVNTAGEVVAKYHIWHHMSIYPPQKVNEGWEKFNL
uniref:hypothetical protein n=1 Tax=Rheinheimera soli TaxID=443616 RepID=UPI001E486607